MGNADSKINFRKSVVQLTTRTQPVDANDEAFWSQFWSDSATCVQDVFTLIPAAEIRALREESPSNLATLCYKAVEKLVQVAENGCRSSKDEQMVQNCVRLLTRLLPYIFEDADWRGFFWSTLPGQKRDEDDRNEEDSVPLAQSLITSLCDLLFCPDFTVLVNKKSGPDNPDDMNTLDSCEFIWAAGVGFTHHPHSSSTIEQNRTELLKLLLTCFSETMYLPTNECHTEMNQWISYFTSIENRHALPLFTSLLNIVCSYDPIGYGLPYNYLMFSDAREPLVEVALHVLCVSLDCDQTSRGTASDANASPRYSFDGSPGAPKTSSDQCGGSENLFINYLSRIHREEDFKFILKGLTRLLNNPLMQTYLPGSSKRIHFHQELLVFFWKICDVNKKFMFHVLKSSDVLDILVPVLFYLNDARSDQSRVGLMHIGVFILLLLSGERNFGVRLNKPYNVRVPMDVPVFTGSHADLLIIVFHKIITTGHQKLQPLFDCLLTIIVNVSPYLKTLSMVSSTKLLHLLEAFSTPWFLFASPSNHHLMFFLLEVFNNIIQYQFDGNSNLVYTIIRKRQVYHQLASMPSDPLSISKALNKSNKKMAHHKEHLIVPPRVQEEGGGGGEVGGSREVADVKEVNGEGVGGVVESMEGSKPATLAEPGTLQASLAATPGIDKMTEKSRAMNVVTEQTETNPEFGSDSELQLERKEIEKNMEANGADDDEPDKSANDADIINDDRGGSREDGFGDSNGVVGGSSGDRKVGSSNGENTGEDISVKKVEGGGKTGVETTDSNSLWMQSPSLSSRLSTTSTTTASSTNRRKTQASTWLATPAWVQSWKQKLPLQTIMRLLQVLVPQVEKICIDKGLTDESEIIKFLQHGTLVGLLPVPHPILIRKYQANSGTTMWFRTYMWGVIYLRNVDPPIWYDTDVKLFEIQRV